MRRGHGCRRIAPPCASGAAALGRMACLDLDGSSAEIFLYATGTRSIRLAGESAPDSGRKAQAAGGAPCAGRRRLRRQARPARLLLRPWKNRAAPAFHRGRGSRAKAQRPRARRLPRCAARVFLGPWGANQAFVKGIFDLRFSGFMASPSRQGRAVDCEERSDCPCAKESPRFKAFTRRRPAFPPRPDPACPPRPFPAFRPALPRG